MNLVLTQRILLGLFLSLCFTCAKGQDGCTLTLNGSKKGEPGNIQDNMFQSLTIDPTDENRVYAGTETNGIFKTTDGGKTWMRLRKGIKCDVNKLSYPQIYEITIDARNNQILYAATVAAPGPVTGGIPALRSNYGGTYKSMDGGLTWKQKVNGFFNTYNPHVAIDPNDSNIIYAGIGGAKTAIDSTFYKGGIMVSRNAGDSWDTLPVPPGASTNTPISMMVKNDAGVSTLFISYMIHGTDQPLAYGMFKTSDFGKTWVELNPQNVKIEYFDVYAKNHSVIYANDGILKKLFKSLDGGKTWITTKLGTCCGPLQIAPNDSNIVIYSNVTKIMKSIDGLESAKEVYDTKLLTNQITDVKISATNPNIVYAASKGYYLYKSVDGGETFTRLTAIRDSVYGVTGMNDINIGGVQQVTCFPNPYNDRTHLQFTLLQNGTAEVKIYDLAGKEVFTPLLREYRLAGNQNVIIEGSSLPQGVYFYRINTETGTFVGKIIHF